MGYGPYLTPNQPTKERVDRLEADRVEQTGVHSALLDSLLLKRKTPPLDPHLLVHTT